MIEATVYLTPHVAFVDNIKLSSRAISQELKDLQEIKRVVALLQVWPARHTVCTPSPRSHSSPPRPAGHLLRPHSPVLGSHDPPPGQSHDCWQPAPKEPGEHSASGDVHVNTHTQTDTHQGKETQKQEQIIIGREKLEVFSPPSAAAAEKEELGEGGGPTWSGAGL